MFLTMDENCIRCGRTIESPRNRTTITDSTVVCWQSGTVQCRIGHSDSSIPSKVSHFILYVSRFQRKNLRAE